MDGICRIDGMKKKDGGLKSGHYGHSGNSENAEKQDSDGICRMDTSGKIVQD
jgi:hypothetical protein